MIQALRDYIGTRYGIFLSRSKKDALQELTEFYSKSQSVLVIMPDNYTDAEFALKVVKFLGKKFRGRNRIVVAMHDIANLVSKNSRAQVVRFGKSDVNMLHLPKKIFLKQFTDQQFDLVIDLNLGFVPFAAYLCSSVNSWYRVSFVKKYGDHFFNIQYRYVPGQEKETTYKSLCHYLEKF